MLSRYLSLPIRIHFLVLVFLLAIPLLCIVLYVGVTERKDALKDAQNEEFKFISSVAREEQVLVTGIRQFATTIALLPGVTTRDNYKIAPLLKEILRDNPQYTNITICDESGRMLESAVPFKKGTSVAHLQYFKEAVRTGMFSSGEYIIGRLTNKPIMIFGYPVKNDAGRVTGVIGIGIDFINIRHVFEKLKFPPEASFSLLDYKGAILYRYPQDNLSTELVGSHDINKELFTSMEEGPEEGTFTAKGDGGVWRIYAYRKMSLPHEAQPYLYIRSSIPQSSVIGKAYRRITAALSVISLLSFAVLFWAWFIGKRIIVDRVTALENASKQLAAGTEILKVSQVVKGGDLGELAKAIDGMAETLQQREKILRTVLEASQETVFMIDLDGHILVMNSTTAQRLGKKPEDMLQKCVYDFLPSDLARSRKIQIVNAVLTGQPIQFSDGHNGRWYENTIYPVSDSDAVAVYSRDITERKQAEEEKRSLVERLHRAEKMEALGQLAGGVAHDLNNVLGVTSGYSELLMEMIPEGNPLREYAAHILKSTEKAAAIIQDLLTLARRGVLVDKVVNLNGIVTNLITTPEFKTLQDYHPRVNIKTCLEKDLLNINGSPVHLEKTLLNLVSNAAEAMVGSGDVDIRTENRYLDRTVPGYDQMQEGDYAVLTVSDTGRGIPATDMDKIFEPFYTKKSMGRSGTGLGLAIVWGTVKDHNGYIDVQSIEGKGTTFTLYFPVTREKMGEGAQKTPVEQYLGHGESVLVVDDVEEQRQVATTLLKQLGYEVNAVSSGKAAVEYLKTNKADILVLDMIMEPGIDGLETYRQIVSFKPKQKAIIVSGFSETERVKEAQKLGAGPYIKKPYQKEKIGVAIRAELNL